MNELEILDDATLARRRRKDKEEGITLEAIAKWIGLTCELCVIKIPIMRTQLNLLKRAEVKLPKLFCASQMNTILSVIEGRQFNSYTDVSYFHPVENYVLVFGFNAVIVQFKENFNVRGNKNYDNGNRSR